MKAIINFLKNSAKPTVKRVIASCLSFSMMTILSMISLVAHAQSSITLSQAISSGLANRKTILAGKLDAALSRLQTKALYRQYFPQVSAQYQYLYNPILQTSILPIGVFNPAYPADATKSVQFGTKWTQSAGLTATFPIVDLSIQRSIDEARLQERILAFSQEQSEYEFAFSIAQTYIDIYLDEAKMRSLASDTSRTYITYILLSDKFDEKRLLKSDLNQARINHNNVVQLLSDGTARLYQDKVYLLFLMGTMDIEKLDFDIDTSFLVSYSVTNNINTAEVNQLPDVQHLTLQSEFTRLQARSARAKCLPTVGFKGYLGANQFANAFKPAAVNTWFGLSYAGLEIKVPILSGESTHNKIRQLNIQSNQYLLLKEDKMLEYSKDVITAKLKIGNAQSQLRMQEENIALSAESIGIFQARVNEGQASVSSLNLEEANIQTLKANYESGKRLLWVYWLDYLKASGQLSILWK
ncbi:MAG: TolC family protein [Chitinophagaceae bacterium]|nr:TolC family protein [Chitinophagaceae bacterium]